MASKKRITTSATKAKLPLPANHPQKREQIGHPRPKYRKRSPKLPESAFENAPSPEAEAFARLMNVPVKNLNNPLMQEAVGRAIPCGEDNVTSGQGVWNTAKVTLPYNPWEGTDAPTWVHAPFPPPDTSAYPWPLKALWRVDGWIVRVRVWLAERLLAASVWVTP